MIKTIFERQLERGVTMRVTVRDDGKHTISFLGGGNVFKFTTDQLGPVSERMKGLHDSIEWDSYTNHMDDTR